MSVREDEIDDSSAPLIEHLAELRTRLIWSVLAFVVALCAVFVVYNPIFNFLARPVCQAMAKHGQECALVMIKLQEGFFVAIRIAFLGGFVLSFPIIGYQLWRFVAPGLYRTEKRAFLPFLIASPFMFVLGAAFAYYIILPMAFDFFLGFQQGALEDAPSEGAEALQRAGILYQGSIEEYLALTIKFVLAFGLCFQLPVLLTLMGKAGLVSADGMASVRKYAIVGILILAAVATPPDVISQIVLFSVVCGLYEISILLVRRIEKRRAAEEAAADAELFGTAPAAGTGTEAATETGAGTGPVEEPAQTVSEAAMLADTAGQGPGEAAGETADPDPGTLPDEEQGDEADIAEGDAGAEPAGHGPASAGIGSAGDESAGDQDAGNAGDEDRSAGAGAGDENDENDEGEEPKP